MVEIEPLGIWVGDNGELANRKLAGDFLDFVDCLFAVSLPDRLWRYPKVVEPIGVAFDDREEADGLVASPNAAHVILCNIASLDS